MNNGYASNWFELHRGVREGCPLSGLLFVSAVEILSIAIRASREIKGIQIANREIKLSQYADDTTVFCRDIFSLGKLLDLVSTFGNCSGLELNVAKSEAMWLGKSANRKDMPFDIKWPKRPIYALGTAFSYNRNLCESENFRVSLGCRGQGYELNILENGRKGGHFGGVQSPLPLLIMLRFTGDIRLYCASTKRIHFLLFWSFF